MSEHENKSEVARLMRQIELGYLAAERGLNGFASGAAKHEFITARMENIGRCHDQLKTLVGEEAAIIALARVMEEAGNETKP